MMRWLLALLVLANVGLYMWGSWYKDADVPVQPLPSLDVNPEQMRLTTDPSVKLVPRTPDKPPVAQALQPVRRVCHAVGAFTSTRAAMGAGGLLKKAALEYSLRTEERLERTWQVYIPPQKSLAAAQALQKHLTRLGFGDNALMQQKEFRHAVSVGLFKVKANADQLQRDLGRKGIKTRVLLQEQKRNRFWLDVPTDTDKLAALKRIRWKQKDITVQETTCTHTPKPATAVKSK